MRERLKTLRVVLAITTLAACDSAPINSRPIALPPLQPISSPTLDLKPTPTTLDIIKQTPTIEPLPTHLDTSTNTPTATVKAIDKTDKPMTSTPTPEVWKIPDVRQRILSFADPVFTTKEWKNSNNRKIITGQFDKEQYPGFGNGGENNIPINACGQSLIATVRKLFTYFKTGNIPDVTTEYVRKFFAGKSFQDKSGGTAPFIYPNDSMEFAAIQPALELLDAQTKLYRVVPITPNWKIGETRLVPKMEWENLIQKSQNEVLREGGVIVAFGAKYGSPLGAGGHFVLITSANYPQVTIVDSWTDSVLTTTLNEFFEKAYYMGVPAEFGLQTGFFGLIGVVPNF